MTYTEMAVPSGCGPITDFVYKVMYKLNMT